MEAIIGVVILFWIITSVAGAMGKQGQQQRKMNVPKRPAGLPPFGNPSWPTHDQEMPQPSSSRQYPQENRTGYEIEQHGSAERERKVADKTPSSSERQVSKAKHQTNEKHDRATTFDSLDSIDIDSPITNPEGRTRRNQQQRSQRTQVANQQKPDLLDQQQIVNGIIWSEILGPPKSRRRR